MSSQQEIYKLLQTFQDGYVRRDIKQINTFMEMFTFDTEIIGTNGVKPEVDEWYTSRDSAKKLVEDDWKEWGDLRLDMDTASIRVRDDVGWIAASATVSQTIGSESYTSYLEFIKEYIETSNLPSEQKLNFILRGGANTIYEIRRGEKFVWALRFTAVVVREIEGWKFAQVNFSFPTTYFPDVRYVDKD